MAIFTYLLVDDDGQLSGTNDKEIAEAAADTDRYNVYQNSAVQGVDDDELLPEDEPEDEDD